MDKRTFVKIGGIAVALSCLPGGAVAQKPAEQPAATAPAKPAAKPAPKLVSVPAPDDAGQRLAEAKARLKLTPYQEDRLRKLLEEEAEAMRAIEEKYGPDKGNSIRRSKLNEMRAAHRDFAVQLPGILSKSQREEWDKMRNEGITRSLEEREKEQRAQQQRTGR